MSRNAADIAELIGCAYAHPPEHVDLDGPAGRIHLRRWDGGAGPPVILVHGTAAHSGWWDHVAPSLAADRQVTAIDLSGHGDSGRRGAYSLSAWADDLRMVVDQLGGEQPPVVVGHSMGGLVALTEALRRPDHVAGLIVLDVAARRMTDIETSRRSKRAGRPHATHPTRAEAAARFKTLGGAAERGNPVVMSHIAAESVTETDRGWTWKVDRRVFVRDPMPLEALRPLPVPVRLVYAEHGLLDADRAAAMAARLGPHTRIDAVAGTGHHLMLEEPVLVTRSLRDWLADCAPPAAAGGPRAPGVESSTGRDDPVHRVDSAGHAR